MRFGLCGAGRHVFKRMCDIAGVYARNFNMYNFGVIGGGYSCNQAYYNDKWHFFDATYGGYFLKDGDVLSWKEIVAEPADAIKHLVVYAQTSDNSYLSEGYLLFWKKANNFDLMYSSYTVESLSNAMFLLKTISKK